MTPEVFPVVMELVKPPSALDAGAGFTLMIALECDAPCDLGKARFEVMDGDRPVHQGDLGSLLIFDPQSPDYDPRNGPVEQRDQAALSLTSPRSIGAFAWRIRLPAQEVDGVAISQASVDFSATTQGHQCSLVVWDAPSPVQAGEEVRFKVGAKCSAGCRLQGLHLRICAEDGQAASEALLEAQHTEAPGLWWGEGVFAAPAQIGLNHYSVHLTSRDLTGLPHGAGETGFSIVVTEAPAHEVRVAVVDEASGAGVENAHVRLGVQRISTNSQGHASAALPKGEHRVFVWKAGYEIPEQMILVDDDCDLTIKALALPPKDPYERWQG